MIKYLFLVAFTLVLNASEYEAKKVTGKDLAALRLIDKKIYDLAVSKEYFNFTSISTFIYKNLAYNLDFTRFKVIGSTSARLTYQDQTENLFTNEGNRLRAQVMVTYPFFDAKESNKILEKIVLVKQKIISQVKKYYVIKAKHKDLEIEKLILVRIETRVKARKLQGVGSFDEWLKVIRDIKKVNIDLSLSEIELSEGKQLLLSFVLQNKRTQLGRML